MREDGVAVVEPVVNDKKVSKVEEVPSTLEVQQQANDKALLLRYSSKQAIKQEKARKLDESNRQLEVIEESISKLDSDISYYSEKEPTDEVVEQITARQKVMLKYLKQQQFYIDKRSDITTQYADIQNRFSEATARLAATH